jgi:hypothetical protein
MILYIAGPMTGLPEFNYPAFFHAEEQLWAMGYGVLNPARHDKCDTWEDYMRLGIAAVLKCDGIALLPGWSNSKGTLLETHIATSLGLPVNPLRFWL